MALHKHFTVAHLRIVQWLNAEGMACVQVLAQKGPRLLLELPSACFTPVLEAYMSAIMRHMLEDPATLQAAMEAEILSTLASGGRARQPGAPGKLACCCAAVGSHDCVEREN